MLGFKSLLVSVYLKLKGCFVLVLSAHSANKTPDHTRITEVAEAEYLSLYSTTESTFEATLLYTLIEGVGSAQVLPAIIPLYDVWEQ